MKEIYPNTDVGSQPASSPKPTLKSTSVADKAGLLELLDIACSRYKDETAIELNSEKISYGSLDARANHIANALISNQLPKGSIIPLLLDNRVDIICSIIGILRAGCVFVPLEADAPQERLQNIVAELSPRCLIIEPEFSALAQTLSPESKVVILTTDALEKVSNERTVFVDPTVESRLQQAGDPLQPEEMCYIYYTSGSTGIPKGIAGNLKGLTHFIKWEIDTFGVEAGWRVSQFTTHTFDAFMRDVFVPLCAGGTICIPPDRPAFMEPAALIRWIDEQRLELIHCVPFLFRVIASGDVNAESFKSLKFILMAGEVLHVSDVKKWNAVFGYRIKLVNFYGSTETTMIKFFHVVQPADIELGFIPIGQPMRGTRALILDDDGNVCPPGVVGELYLRSPYFTLGYFNNPESTREIFVPNPFSKNPADTIFKTGDLARLLDNGNFQFIGRKDNLVKLRGFRVELGDIESQLRRHNSVSGAVVMAWEDVPGDKQLVAYVTTGSDVEQKPTNNELRQFLSEKLPDYMIPAAIIFMDEFPLTPNGKVDRRTLPVPDKTWRDKDERLVVPRNPIEELLVEIWARVLKLDQVGVYDNFFRLGGHSLLATQVIARVRDIFQVEVPLRSFFQSPTIAVMAERIEAERQEKQGVLVPPIVPVSRDGELRLSFAQQRLWFFDQFEPQTFAYNMPAAVRYRGELNVQALERAFNEIVRRHEVLRTTFLNVDGRPCQIIHHDAALKISVIDLGNLDEDEREACAQQLATEEAQRPFNLAADMMLRVTVVRLDAQDHAVLLTMHHIASDGWSMGILLNELSAFYDSYCKSEAATLPALPVQYVDYAAWQREWLQGEVLEEQLSYWKQRLGDGSPVLQLPLDKPRPFLQSYNGARQRFFVSSTVAEKLKMLGRQEGTTLFMTLVAAFQTLLYRYTGQEDISVGTPVAGRTRQEVEGLIGFFVNTLVLRTELNGDPTFRELLRRVREVCLGAYAHQEVPFEKLVEQVQPERDMSYTPLFQALFVLNNLPEQTSGFVPQELTTVEFQRGSSKFDLSLYMSDMTQGMIAIFEYNTDLFELSTINRMIEHFQRMLDGIATNADERLSLLPLLSSTEEQQLVSEWNNTQADYADASCIHELFEIQVRQRPNAVAVISEQQLFTYEELNRRANQLAHYLRNMGLGLEVPVALCLERSVDVVVGLLAIMKAGGVYVPLDPEYPSERLSFMLTDSGARVLVTNESLLDSLPEHGAQLVCLDRDREQIAQQPSENPASGVGPEHLAYIIYTSGSTGEAKGVLVQHRGLCNLSAVQVRSFGVQPESRVLQFFSFSFDASLWDVLMGLMSGATLYIASQESRVSASDLIALLKEQSISIVTLPPTILATLPAEELPDLLSIITTGEACTADLVARWQAGRRFFNGYGPTETTIGATFLECIETDRKPSIGRPYANMQVYILDRNLQLVPIGVAGELHVAGVGLARGYLNRPELTADKFRPNPFSQEPGARMYGTGDFARYLPDGNLEFLGRIDDQVKVRGFRVELGEIETVLGRHPLVQEVAVVAREDEHRRKRLIAYVATWSETPSIQDLRSYLKEQLPDYMIPGQYVMMERLPRLASGKVDRQALPAPEAVRPELSARLVGPRTASEGVLCRIWAEVLGVERVGIHDNFFELGGDSIISIQVVARAKQAGLQLSTRQLFQQQTIAELAGVAGTEEVVEAEQGIVTGPVGLTPIQQWFFGQQREERHHYNQSVLLQAQRRLEARLVERSVWELMRHHDGLRLRYEQEESGQWQQEIMGLEEELRRRAFTVVDLSGVADGSLAAAIERGAAEAQQSFDLGAGPLVKVVLFEAGEQRAQRLLIVGHHLAVDGVSWRILVQDLGTVYEQLEAGVAVRLPAKTSSLAEWSRRLREYGGGAGVRGEVAYWEAEGRGVERLPVDHEERDNGLEQVETVGRSLSVEQTRALLQEVPAAYGTQINEVLLTGMVLAFSGWSGAERLLIDLEGHGREEVLEGVDVTRTVGWFTSFYPVCLEGGRGEEIGVVLKRVKEKLRGVPGRGLGYLLLKYEQGELGGVLAAAEVSFNYLGQFDQALAGSGGGESRFVVAGERKGKGRSERGERTHLIEVNGGVAGGQLHLAWDYSRGVHRRETIEELARRYEQALEEVIEHCAEAVGYTPSDFELARLNQEEVDELFGAQRGIEDVYPLSPMQQGMLFHNLYQPGSGANTVQTSYGIAGEFNEEAFAQAWRRVLEQHSVLRTSFIWGGVAEPLQVVHREVELPLVQEDWRDLTAEQQQRKFEALLKEDRNREFDLKKAPLLRLILIRTGDNSYQLISSFNHLLADGWSWPIILKDVFRGYDAYCHGETVALEAVRPYRDYIAWLQQQDTSTAEPFWREHLRGFSAPTPLPVDRIPDQPEGQDEDYLEHRVLLSKELSAQLQTVSRYSQLTMNTLMQGTYALLLSRYSREKDVVFGAVVAGRPAELPGVETMVGNFINTLPVRVYVPSDAQTLSWLSELQSQQVDMRQYEYSSLAQVQLWSEVPRAYPLFESILIFENYPLDASIRSEGGGLVGIHNVKALERTNYPLSLVIVPGERISLRMIYDRRRFNDDTIQRMMGHFEHLFEGLAGQPEQPLSSLSLLSEAERQQLVQEWNETAHALRGPECLHELVMEQAGRTPEAIAVIGSGGKQVSYRELDERSNQVAHYLRGQGVSAETRVGLCLQRSEQLVVGLLGILKAGGCYVTLDVQYPLARLERMLEESGVAVVVTEEALLEALPAHWARVVSIDGEWAEIAQESVAAIESGVSGENLAYVIYTSGSTGLPKGVMVPHRGLPNLVTAQAELFGAGVGDRVLQFASLSFDASVFEIMMALASGATLCFARREELIAGPELVRFMREKGISNVTLPASALAVMPTEELPELRTMVLAGEALTADLVERWAKGRELFNAYGPTEATIWSSVSRCVNGNDTPSIGKPILNTRIYLLDQHLEPVPVGVTGELYISGIGLARGYLNLPDTTAEKFIPDPFSVEPGQQMYKSGDLARYQPDGNIMFIGRTDHQVKVRGFRIETGEIEAVLKEFNEVIDAVVVVKESTNGDKMLAAYVVPAPNHHPEERELRDFLKQRLPEYMLPTIFLTLEALPLTPSGKVDRRALPSLEVEHQRSESEIILPRTTTEKTLIQIWSQVLDRRQISIYDNFLDLGGHSLLVANTIHMIQESFGVELPMRFIFEAPNLLKLAEVIDTVQRDGIDAALAAITVIDPNDEAVLDESIYPEGDPVDLEAEPENILLTGATGFLGAFMLRELMRQTSARIHCLVRCSDQEQGRRRIQQTLERFMIWEDAYADRIVVLPGDLSQSLLGLREDEFQRLSLELDSIYHSGASVGFLDPYYRLKPTNVGGTKEIIKLACRGRVKPLHHVSSLSAFISIGHADDGVFREDQPLERWQHPGGGYAQSKWVSERMVLIARSRGLPVTLYRPGAVTGDSQTGAWNTDDMMCRLIMGCIQIGSAPYADTSLPFTPVDFVAQAIIYLSRKKEAFSKIYHISNPKPGSAATIVRDITALGYPLKFVWFDEWQERLFAAIDKYGENALSRFVPMFQRAKSPDEVYSGEPMTPQPSRVPPPQADSVSADEYGQLVYDCRNMLAALEGSSIECPPVGRDLIEVYLSYLVRVGLLEEPHAYEMMASTA